jgi:hypothetical protein
MYQKMPSAGMEFGSTLGTVPYPIPVSPRRHRVPFAALGCVTLEEGDERSVPRLPIRSRAWQSADQNWRTGAYTVTGTWMAQRPKIKGISLSVLPDRSDNGYRL